MNPRIIHQGDEVLVIDKPSGWSVLADRDGGPTLWPWLADSCRAAGAEKPLPVHRIDKGTSGILVVALTPGAQASLNRQFQRGSVLKCYTAISATVPLAPRALVDLPLQEGRKSRYRVAGLREDIVLDAKTMPPTWRLRDGAQKAIRKSYPSQTAYRVIRPDGGRAVLAIRLHTGRRHQIRVHLSWIGAPLLGDHLYGRPNDPTQQAERLMLHCRKIGFEIDWSGRRRRALFRAALPEGWFG